MKNQVVFIGFLLAGLATAWSRESRRIDINGDGYKEAEVYYSGKEIIKTLADYDHDGRMETVIYYKNGHREHAEQDINRDGKTDRWIYYYFTGVPWKVAEDRNGNEKPDYWFYLKDGKIYKWEQDRNGDGRADIRTTYEVDKAGKVRTLVQQSYDDDFDGVFESFSGITAAKKEAMIPHSLAEALLR
jgi:antitoxin component YwqK of YwqJK toxin-antitoxin module